MSTRLLALLDTHKKVEKTSLLRCTALFFRHIVARTSGSFIPEALSLGADNLHRDNFCDDAKAIDRGISRIRRWDTRRDDKQLLGVDIESILLVENPSTPFTWQF